MSHTVMARTVVVVIGFMVGTALVSGHAASFSYTSQNLTPYRTCTVTATPSSTTSVIDAHVQQANLTTNFGASTTMTVATGVNLNRRIHIRFDLGGCSPVIPATATIRLATLRLYASTLAATCRTMAIFRVNSSWTEAGVTWNNQPFGTTINNPPTASRSGTFSVGTPAGCQNQAAGYVTGGTVTSDVASFVAGSVTNFGWMIDCMTKLITEYATMTMIISRGPPSSRASRAGGTTPMMNPTLGM